VTIKFSEKIDILNELIKIILQDHYKKNFIILKSVQTGSGSHPASYPMVIRYSFLGGKAARA